MDIVETCFAAGLVVALIFLFQEVVKFTQGESKSKKSGNSAVSYAPFSPAIPSEDKRDIPASVVSNDANTFIIDYENASADMSTRKVSVQFFNDKYIQAYCYKREDLRTFKFSRIHKILDSKRREISVDEFLTLLENNGVKNLDHAKESFMEDRIWPALHILGYLASLDGSLEGHVDEIMEYLDDSFEKAPFFLTGKEQQSIEDGLIEKGVSKAKFDRALKIVEKWDIDERLDLKDWVFQVSEMYEFSEGEEKRALRKVNKTLDPFFEE